MFWEEAWWREVEPHLTPRELAEYRRAVGEGDIGRLARVMRQLAAGVRARVPAAALAAPAAPAVPAAPAAPVPPTPEQIAAGLLRGEWPAGIREEIEAAGRELLAAREAELALEHRRLMDRLMAEYARRRMLRGTAFEAGVVGIEAARQRALDELRRRIAAGELALGPEAVQAGIRQAMGALGLGVGDIAGEQLRRMLAREEERRRVGGAIGGIMGALAQWGLPELLRPRPDLPEWADPLRRGALLGEGGFVPPME